MAVKLHLAFVHRLSSIFSLLWISCLFVLLAVPTGLASAQPLLPDPLIFKGKLDNGLHYAVMPNDSPADTASVRLYIGAGSLHELEHERGFAHFVEHMAFNGSEAFPEGELIKALQNAGLAFGAHANASTDFERTLYTLELPNVDDETVELALKVFRETASNLSFADDAIERERGVLISELEARNGKGLQVFREQLKFWDPTSRANERFAAGTKETIIAATREDLLAFYRAFYRPENAYLVLVGDIELDDIEAKIEAAFSDWQNDTPERDLAYMEERLVPEQKLEDHVVFSLDGINTQLSMVVSAPYEDVPDSTASRELLIKRSMANSILAQRMDKLTRQQDAPILGVRVSHSRLFEDAMLASFAVSTTDERLMDAAALMEQEMRRVLTYGFTDAEVEEQKANFNLSYQYQVDAADKRPNAGLANGLVSSFQADTVFIHPEDSQAIYKGIERDLTPDTLLETFKDMWQGKARFFATTSTPIGDGPNQLAETLATSKEVAIDAVEEAEVTEFAYHEFGTPGEIVSREEDTNLAFTKVRFANNLRVNLKPTRWEDNTVRMLLRLGGGIASLPADIAGIRNLINFGYINGGLGKHEVTDLPRLLAGHTAAARLRATNSTYAMSAGVIPDDMLLQFKLWAAYLTDPAFRSEAQGQYLRAVDSYFQSLKSSPGGVFGAYVGKYIYTDPRFTLEPIEKLKAYTMADLKSVMSEVATKGALELTIVGDFEVDAALEALKTTLGALPERELEPVFDPAVREIAFPAETQEVTFHHEGGADQANLYMYWPTAGRSDHKLNAELALLRDVLQIMMTDSLREEAGLAYTPSVSKYASSLFNDYGYIAISSDIGPSEIDDAKQIFKSTVAQLVAGGFDEDLLERARKPLLESLRNQKKNNGNWIANLQSAQSNPDYIKYYAGLEAAVETITREQIIDAAKRFLDTDPRLTVDVVHKDAPARQSEAN